MSEPKKQSNDELSKVETPERYQRVSPINQPKIELQNRLTVSESTYFQARGTQPIAINSRYYRWIESEEEPYRSPIIKLDYSWKVLQLGWLKEGPLSLLLIENIEGHPTHQQGRPTKEELAEIRLRVMEFAFTQTEAGDEFMKPAGFIPPGESARFTPSEPQQIRLRARPGAGVVRCRVVLFPE